MSSSPQKTDPRRQRTRDELLSAFFTLVLSRRYHEIRVADVLAAAGVGRSTFYEHFRNKDELLSAALYGPFSILAGIVSAEAGTARVAGILQHFWENRALARSIFHGAALRVVRRALIAQIESSLARQYRSRLRIPPRLAAHALADGMFSPIVAWLSGEAACSAGDLAAALQLSATATLRALQVSAGADESVRAG
ncbi:TetR/AcrR family transcriptional regulator [Tahibacter harae]|uniref:TetR/AcrR family transcriptional regulator n=1 Tax=Tahibacter harae TaxID=2963937 RepID=A0ABT1QR13_9GAMM|nr:TetR/AcrR family transcriptional regulator [Tahibacter harae]MCQ4164719.1 TetR/AcrR family transcriptional regulator [Tahibacter harae]